MFLNSWVEPACEGTAPCSFGRLWVCGREQKTPWGKKCLGKTAFLAVMGARINGICKTRGFQGA